VLDNALHPVRMDNAAEYEIFKSSPDILDIESHGYTHMVSDIKRWLRAEDKYTNKAWYRELYDMHDERDLSDTEIRGVLERSAEKITAWFGRAPTTLVPPGQQASQNTCVIAGDLGFKLLSMKSAYLLSSEYYIQSTNILNPDLSHWRDFDATLIADGFPAVGYLHDRDIALHGPAWFSDCLQGWKERGMQRFITFRELTGLLFAKVAVFVEKDRICGWVNIEGTGGIGDVPGDRHFNDHPFPLRVNLPPGEAVEKVLINGSAVSLSAVNRAGDVMITLPAFSSRSQQEFVIQMR